MTSTYGDMLLNMLKSLKKAEDNPQVTKEDVIASHRNDIFFLMTAMLAHPLNHHMGAPFSANHNDAHPNASSAESS
eukprot:3938889-Rhodomonas_salina.1